MTPAFSFIILCILVMNTSAKDSLPFNVLVHQNNSFIPCIARIIKLYYPDTITYVDCNSDDNEMLKEIHSRTSHLIISRTTFSQLHLPNMGYVVTAQSAADFSGHFGQLAREAEWNPAAKFLIVIKNLFEDNLRGIFKELLKHHIFNVIVVNGTGDAEVYTFNPFRNFMCGKNFERISFIGKCNSSPSVNFFPNKMINGIRNCTVVAAVSHMPPYAIDINRNKDEYHMWGLEQYVFNIISEREQFNINYLYVDFGEAVSVVDSNMTAHGMLGLIQNNEADVVLGFMVLTGNRGAAFYYLYEHLAYTDEFTFIVHKTGDAPPWKSIYQEFTSTVWILLLLSFIACALLITNLINGTDKASVVLAMFDNLLLHARVLRCRRYVKYILTLWLWFSYLINSFYQSSLVSLTAHPSRDFQVSNEEELKASQFKPCVSNVINEFMTSVKSTTYPTQNKKCMQLVKSLEMVGKSTQLFTITPLSIYNYNRYMFLDKKGESTLYHFRQPIFKAMYAIYLYKGFPMYNQLRMYLLRLRESGLMSRHSEALARGRHRGRGGRGAPPPPAFHSRALLPWPLLLAAAALATIIFLLEILTNAP